MKLAVEKSLVKAGREVCGVGLCGKAWHASGRECNASVRERRGANGMSRLLEGTAGCARSRPARKKGESIRSFIGFQAERLTRTTEVFDALELRKAAPRGLGCGGFARPERRSIEWWVWVPGSVVER
jgi:hypothetical protein